jgi:hypothetical protein
MVQGFNAWAGWKDATQAYARFDVQAFAELPRDEQRRLVVEAQQMAEEADTNYESTFGAAQAGNSSRRGNSLSRVDASETGSRQSPRSRPSATAVPGRSGQQPR